ncbi:hypothetical protein GGR55DRAFT_384059 [Xylaria sp. FL0064]|nr:hypothetical protein GGR55DRAFT_384059 [Xylaria sp. FL0064]
MSLVSPSSVIFAPVVTPSDSSRSDSPLATLSSSSPLDVQTTTLPSSSIVPSPTTESVPSSLLNPTVFSPLPSSTSSIASTFLPSAATPQEIGSIISSTSASDIISTGIVNAIPSPTSSTQSSSPTSRVISTTTLSTFTSSPTGDLSSSRTTALSTTQVTQPPLPLDASPQSSPITLIVPSTPPTSPTNASPPSITDHGEPPILVILAIVISVVVSVLLFTIILRKLATSRRQRGSYQTQDLQPSTRQCDFPRPVLDSESVRSTNSFAATYHSAPRGAMRVTDEGTFADEEGWRQGHPWYQDDLTMLGAMRGGMIDSVRWSAASLDENNGVLDTGPGTSKRDARVYQSVNKVGIGRAY